MNKQVLNFDQEQLVPFIQKYSELNLDILKTLITLNRLNI